MADDEDAPSLINTKFNRVQSAVRRARSPPRNEHNQMYCDHVNCTGKNQTFKRVCEWNKHMDRHERPYKCREAGCELNPGFTYSGGLLRHQREVHKMHLSTKQPLYCPFPNCNRSSGTGFTRKENLEEHKRRRHLEEMSDRASSSRRGSSNPPPATLLSQHQQAGEGEPQFKRRRISSTATIDDPPQYRAHHHRRLEPGNTATGTAINSIPSGSSVAMDASGPVAVLPESELVRWLRAEIQRKDEIIVRHATELHRLQNLLRALPPQTVYGVNVMQPRLQSGGGTG
ncbi:uncharacterized protein A1O9_06354 [Exophiala aquamarina CBS 119918]|uniref:C2H2-type domain-containing protein n=1 Tax=Exophiala aquamarina CBS 119918 TaxID=1182545 RepID=A0A072PGK1_9EURO|nr:uncharacterized protein A1O9_06354 [Exophiala aquamarina CBS 119918]KEF58428.1 hypothetical protein A1O9_06354 [Exophiala aquamarina CBS 119918]